MKTNFLYAVLLASASFIFSATASAQVFDPGVSDSDLFTFVVNLPDDPFPTPPFGQGIGGVAGQTIQINVGDGGSVPGLHVTVHEGVEVNLNPGSSAIGIFEAFNGSEVNISGGATELTLFNAGSVANISGGTSFAHTFEDGSVANISALLSQADGDNYFGAINGSEVNLFGSNFAIDGVPIEGLVPGEAFTISERNVTLTGLWEDGTEFSIFAETAMRNGIDYFLVQEDATLTVTSTSTASEMLMGDVNRDGGVVFLDVTPFIGVLFSREFQVEADCDENGNVDFFDINPFIGILSSN